jgi:hypothetical protein
MVLDFLGFAGHLQHDDGGADHAGNVVRRAPSVNGDEIRALTEPAPCDVMALKGRVAR